MKHMKYLVYQEPGLDIERFVIFDQGINHSDIASKLIGPIVSAGIISFNGKNLSCVGESVSLRVSSRGKKDSDFINRELGFGMA